MSRRFDPAREFALFWTLEPSQRDIDNLDLCNAKRVQLTYTLARDKPGVLDLLAGKQKDVVLRATPEDLIEGILRVSVAQNVRRMRERANVVGFIGWNEPEFGINWAFENDDGTPANWNREYARHHAAEVSAFADMWKATNVGVPLVAPPWSVHAIAEDDPPQPGMEMWNDETRYAYVKCEGGRGVHWYQWKWDSVGGVNVNKLRLKQMARTDATFSHQLLWVDEVGIYDRGLPQVDKMFAYVEMVDWLVSPTQRLPGRLGTRVVHFSPFLSNGTQEWEHFLLTDRWPYEVLRDAILRWKSL